jgi:hypothetical protein
MCRIIRDSKAPRALLGDLCPLIGDAKWVLTSEGDVSQPELNGQCLFIYRPGEAWAEMATYLCCRT